ncbi:hypothetical protein DXF96_01180 [Heyndrickxia coagulans]|uniref:Uncharacterized protein n=1 Tax=Heyndrickxia coagulans TaxID=1398 RepID=A0A133L297_HEYCO|nr:hypothetical protein CIW84_04630 [Heyndrickxia coagulans]AVD57018.1 hypothetical protein C3766_13335 [Heyndrickxia coagulans]AWP37957.1 hypothetical protein CYJ15_13680 [Heyndrickxia coagulans]KGB29162.1 hypothetical protein IE89_12835 [Heyndrickxia coagulans]KWZ86103.1 hypothetical protein HMPREF3213_00164 [Heyndrickxia coagulans]
MGKRPGDPDHFRQWRFHTRKAGEIQPGSVAGILSGQGLEKMQLKTFGRDFSPGSFVSTGRMIPTISGIGASTHERAGR